MNAISTTEGYNAIANQTCAYYNNRPVILADHRSFILACVSQEDECPNGAINSDQIEDLWCYKSQCFDIIKRMSFARQISAIIKSKASDRESEKQLRTAMLAELIQKSKLKYIKKSNQHHQKLDNPTPPTKSENYSPNNYQLTNLKPISSPQSSVFLSANKMRRMPQLRGWQWPNQIW